MSGREDVPFWGLTPQQIYEQLTTGPGSGRFSDAGSAASQEWQREEERAKEILALAEDMKAGWDGPAGDAAHGATGPLATSAVGGATQLHISEQFLNRQTESFHSAANSVVPVPDKPPESTVLNDMIPWETDLDKEIQSYQADAQHNIEVFRTYDTTSLDHETPLSREYQTTTHSGGDISVRGPGGTIDSDDYKDPGERGSGGDPTSGGDGARGGTPGGSPVSAPPAGGYDAPGSTQTSQVSPSATPGPGVQGAVPPVSQPGPMTTSSPVGLVGAGPVAGAAPPGTGGGSGVPGGRSGGPGSGGLGGRGGGAGGGPGVRGGGPGAGAGALAAEQAAQRGGVAGASGARGGTGMGGVPMGASGRGKGDEDGEHQRKVLIEPDPESTFGNDKLTAPQVIGDPRYEDDE